MTTATAAPEAAGGAAQQTQTNDAGSRPGYLAHVKDNSLKSDSAIGTFLSEKAPDLDSLVKGYHELSTKSANMVEIPGQDAAPEAVEAFWAKMGKPESPDKYELPRLEGDYAQFFDEAQEKAFRETAHALHVPAQTAKALVEWHNQQIVAQAAAMREAEANGLKEAETALRKDWGKEYDGNIRLAQSAMKVLSDGNEDVMATFNIQTASGMRLGDSPALVKLFHRVALSLSEDTITTGSGGTKEEKAKTDASGHHMLSYRDESGVMM